MLLARLFFGYHLEEGENIKYIARQHIWLHRKPLFKSLLLGVTLPVTLALIFPPFLIYWFVWLLVGGFWFFYRICDWYFDAWLVTDRSVLDIEWNGFFHRSSTRLEYHTISGLSFTITGFWGTVFRYGRISIDTYGNNSFVLENAANPKEVELNILACQEKAVENQSYRDHETLKGILAEMIANRKS